MKLSALLAPLLDAKADHEMIRRTILAYEAEQSGAVDASKEKARARWHKWNDKRLQTLANVSSPLVSEHAHVEDNLQNKKTSKEENKQETAQSARVGDLAAFKAELSTEGLDPERIEAIVKHRRTKRGQLTALSARLFVTDAKACDLSLPDAADACISRNWLTVKPEYFAGRQRQQPSTAPPGQRTMNDVLNEIIQGKPENGFTGTTVDASYERTDRGSAQGVVQFDAFAARQRP